jgi:large subunit ribosomal protein L24
MKGTWSACWNRSIRPNKQRKFRFNAPLHIKQSFLHVHLSKELHKEYKRRAAQVRKGDTVKIIRGQYSKKKGKVERVSLIRQRVFIEGLEQVRKDGNKTLIAFQPSNLMITDLDLTDKKRKNKFVIKEGAKKE